MLSGARAAFGATFREFHRHETSTAETSPNRRSIRPAQGEAQSEAAPATGEGGTLRRKSNSRHPEPCGNGAVLEPLGAAQSRIDVISPIRERRQTDVLVFVTRSCLLRQGTVCQTRARPTEVSNIGAPMCHWWVVNVAS